jgi:hypothetical protein
MGLQVSGSNTGLLLQCPFPFSEDLELPEREPDGEPARYGLAYHEINSVVVPAAIEGREVGIVVGDVLKKYGLPISLGAELNDHVNLGLKILMPWLKGDNVYSYNFLKGMTMAVAETSRAINLSQAAWRLIAAPMLEGHRYADVERSEIPTTLDLVLDGRFKTGKAWSLVIDYKTGRLGDWSQPRRVPQMRTGSLAVSADRTFLAVLDANRRGVPAVYTDEATQSGKVQFARRLRLALAKIGSGFLRTGPECRWCPARPVCPAQSADLVAEGHAIVKALEGKLEGLSARADLTPAQKVGVLHQFFAHVHRLEEPLRKKMSEFVEQSEEIVERPDGKVLGFEDREVERTPGKQAYIDALGKAEAERRFELLRKEGLMAPKKERQLRAFDNERVRR